MRPLSLPCAPSILGLSALVAVGCTVPGPVDEAAALEVVYDQQGTPAFAGQALVIQSCGAGGFCHREEREGLNPEDRFNAPAGLNFDLSLATTSREVAEPEILRQRAHQSSMLDNAVLVWDQVSSRHMPPEGEAGDDYAAQVERLGIRYDRFSDAGDPTPLPGIDTEEGLEIFRNWLAAGGPVVERTEDFNRIGDVTGLEEGFVAPACSRECVEPTFESIYRIVIRPTCTSSRCHDSDEPAAELDMRFAEVTATDPAAFETELAVVTGQAWSRLLVDGSLSSAEQCSGEGLPMVEADNAMGSILYRKLFFASDDSSQCGSRMPLSGTPLNEQRLCAVRTWIDCGACAPDDDTCDACVDAGRAACGVTAAGECADVTTCSNRLP
ncbi:MAG: hypothetical protein AB8I08_31490 [Sandaracinaceae bacterium]